MLINWIFHNKYESDFLLLYTRNLSNERLKPVLSTKFLNLYSSAVVSKSWSEMFVLKLSGLQSLPNMTLVWSEHLLIFGYIMINSSLFMRIFTYVLLNILTILKHSSITNTILSILTHILCKNTKLNNTIKKNV